MRSSLTSIWFRCSSEFVTPHTLSIHRIIMNTRNLFDLTSTLQQTDEQAFWLSFCNRIAWLSRFRLGPLLWPLSYNFRFVSPFVSLLPVSLARLVCKTPSPAFVRLPTYCDQSRRCAFSPFRRATWVSTVASCSTLVGGSAVDVAGCSPPRPSSSHYRY